VSRSISSPLFRLLVLLQRFLGHPPIGLGDTGVAPNQVNIHVTIVVRTVNVSFVFTDVSFIPAFT